MFALSARCNYVGSGFKFYMNMNIWIWIWKPLLRSA